MPEKSQEREKQGSSDDSGGKRERESSSGLGRGCRCQILAGDGGNNEGEEEGLEDEEAKLSGHFVCQLNDR